MLYGSVSTRDIADAVTAGGVNVSRDQVVLDKAIKALVAKAEHNNWPWWPPRPFE